MSEGRTCRYELARACVTRAVVGIHVEGVWSYTVIGMKINDLGRKGYRLYQPQLGVLLGSTNTVIIVTYILVARME